MTFSNLNWIIYTHKIVSLHTNYFLAAQNYIFIGYRIYNKSLLKQARVKYMYR